MARTAQEYLGSYRLLNKVRDGKTCQVWEVMNDLNTQRYAVKLLLAEYRNNKEEVFYLRHEHEVGRKLDHPRVIHIYDFGVDQDNVYLAMELFNVPNVKQLINLGHEKLFPLVKSFIEQAGDGLAYFHAQGWVHRDIKPDNYLMDTEGHVKLIDFALADRARKGIARLFARRSKIQGTRSYMSPEQIRGQALDDRADIYSFGCMVHELVGGKPPFTGVSTNDLLNKHLKSAPPPLQASNRNVTDEFAGWVRKMLAKKPEQRQPSMVEVLSEFRRLEIFKEQPKRLAT